MEPQELIVLTLMLHMVCMLRKTLKRSQHPLLLPNLTESSQLALEPQVRNQVSTAERLEHRELPNLSALLKKIQRKKLHPLSLPNLTESSQLALEL